jgi:hypothetical protein
LCERYCYGHGFVGRDDLYQIEIGLWIEALTCEQSAANKPSEGFMPQIQTICLRFCFDRSALEKPDYLVSTLCFIQGPIFPFTFSGKLRLVSGFHSLVNLLHT